MSDSDRVEFPQYPSPDKVDFAERSQSRILWKALKNLTKPKVRVKTRPQRNWKKKLPYY